MVVRNDRRGLGLGKRLLSTVEAQARHRGLRRLFALSVDAADWFATCGFVGGERLPPERRSLRRSTPLFKSLL